MRTNTNLLPMPLLRWLESPAITAGRTSEKGVCPSDVSEVDSDPCKYPLLRLTNTNLLPMPLLRWLESPAITAGTTSEKRVCPSDVSEVDSDPCIGYKCLQNL